MTFSTMLNHITMSASAMLHDIIAMLPEYFQQAGVTLWLLFTLSFIVTIIVLEQSYAWLSYPTKKEKIFLNDCFTALHKDQPAQALDISLNLSSPALKLLKKGIESLPLPPNEIMQAAAKQQLLIMAHGQAMLRCTVVIAPLLGLIGSLLSLKYHLQNFSIQSSITQSDYLLLISDVLAFNALSLCIALYAFIAASLFQVQGDRLAVRLAAINAEFNAIYQQTLQTRREQATDKAPTQEVYVPQTVAEHHSMPYHYEFEEGSDDVSVNLHQEMQDIHKPSQSSLMTMYENGPLVKKNTKDE